MNENAGLMFLISLPPYAFSFGIHPLHWAIGQMELEAKCAVCNGISRSNMLRLGPLTFVVTHQEHDDDH